MQRAAVFLAVLLGVLIVVAPMAYAASVIKFSVGEPYSVETTVTVEVFHESVSIEANGTYTINVSLPEKWTGDDIQAVYVVASGVTGKIQLSAQDVNGSELATATVVPLSSGEYKTTLPAGTAKIVLSSSEKANATITVLVESKPVEFQVELKEDSITLEPGTAGWVHGTIKQVEGPEVWIWTITATNSNKLKAATYRGSYDSGSTPSTSMLFDSNPVDTSGEGWSQEFSILIDAGQMTQDDAGEYSVTVHFYVDYDFESPETPTIGQLVYTINLSGSLVDDKLHFNVDNVDAKSLGVGIVVAFVLGFAVLGFAKGRGRRANASPIAILVLFLAILAAAGLALGVMDFDLKARYDIDPMYLGVGMLAALALVLMFKAGYVRVPRILKR